MHQICLEELTIRVMELERQMRAVHLDAQTARSSRFAQIKERQDLQARAAAADERAAAADERSAVERIKTAQALNQCKVKQQQYRQLQISLHRELVANMQEQQQRQVLEVLLVLGGAGGGAGKSHSYRGGGGGC